MLRLALCLAVLLAGCAGAPQYVPDRADSGEARCDAAYAAVDRVVADAGVADGMAARIAGFPYLRVDRFLASFAGETMNDDAMRRWTERMQALDAQARRLELANLPAGSREALARELPGLGEPLPAALERCSAMLAARDLANPARRAALRETARVPDDYQAWKRVLGLYALSRIPFAAGVRDWHRSTAQTYALDPDKLPVSGALARYVPPAAAVSAREVTDIFRSAKTDALGIPEFGAREVDVLFAAFAPALEIDTLGADDRIGAVRLDADGRPQVDVGEALAYRRIAYTRFQGRVLVQLVYSFWFPSRTAESAFDLLAGNLDGITWRVTLGKEGEPWIFDTMHNCGCYHMFFPTARAVALPLADTLDEQAFVPQILAAVRAGERLTLRVSARAHYVQRVTAGIALDGANSYRYADDDALRSLAAGEGRRSLFAADGIVASSARLERFLFWPMGVPNPGAMRQWGRHSTAFVGRRHFDDPDLMEKSFRDISP